MISRLREVTSKPLSRSISRPLLFFLILVNLPLSPVSRTHSHTHGTQSLLEMKVKSRSYPHRKKSNEYCVEGAERRKCSAAMHTSVRCLWRWRRMAVSGQLCRVAEGLSYHAKTLTHCHPPQKSDTRANSV